MEYLLCAGHFLKHLGHVSGPTETQRCLKELTVHCQCGMVMLCVVAGEDEGDILEAQAAWRGQ